MRRSGLRRLSIAAVVGSLVLAAATQGCSSILGLKEGTERDGGSLDAASDVGDALFADTYTADTATADAASTDAVPSDAVSESIGPGDAADAEAEANAPDAQCEGGGCDDIVQIAAGAGPNCVLRRNGRVSCWGDNVRRGVGQPPAGDSTCPQAFGESHPCRTSPVEVPGLTGVAAVSVGWNFACAILASDGSVWCWGSNDHGQLGHDPVATGDPTCQGFPCNDRPMPVGLSSAVEVGTGNGFACARTNANAVFCWGANDHGQLGRGGSPGADSYQVSPVTGLGSGVTSLGVSGNDYACAVRSDQSVWCWGQNRFYQLGHDLALDPTCAASQPCSTTPTQVLADPDGITHLSNVQSVAAGDGAACALLGDKSVRCWGFANDGQLALGPSAATTWVPQIITTLSGVDAIAGRNDHFCALAGGLVRCWGRNDIGDLGDGFPPADAGAGGCKSGGACGPVPQQVVALPGVGAMSIFWSNLAQAVDGGVYGWGPDETGELGHTPGMAGDGLCTFGISTVQGPCNSTPSLIPGLP
jgi:alpha-tubulin suppressor-like RCC1 family protein